MKHKPIFAFDFSMNKPAMACLIENELSFYIWPLNIDKVTQEKLDSCDINIVNRKLNYLYADIETKEEGFCVISIPYDKGWNITVNGNVVETYSVNGGMIGIRLDKGYSEVVMTFMPSGLKTGCLLSSIGIMMFLILFVKERKYL